jgi:hypothetical protein
MGLRAWSRSGRNSLSGSISADGSLACPVSGDRGHGPDRQSDRQRGKGPCHTVEGGRDWPGRPSEARESREEGDQPSSSSTASLTVSKCDGRIGGPGQTGGKGNRVLDSLATCLAKVGSHGVRGVTHQGHRPTTPPGRQGSVDDIVAHRPLRSSGLQKVWNGLRPVAERLAEIGVIAACESVTLGGPGGSKPVGVSIASCRPRPSHHITAGPRRRPRQLR